MRMRAVGQVRKGGGRSAMPVKLVATIVASMIGQSAVAQESVDLRKKVEWDAECRQAKAYIRQSAPVYTAEQVDKMGCAIAKSIAELYGWKSQATLQREREEAARKAERERQLAAQQARNDVFWAAQQRQWDQFWAQQRLRWDELTTPGWTPPHNWDNGLRFEPAPGWSQSPTQPPTAGTSVPTPGDIAAVANALAQTRAAASQARAMGKHDQAALLDQSARQIEQQLAVLKALAGPFQPGDPFPRYEPYPGDPDTPPAGVPGNAPIGGGQQGQPPETQPRTNTELLDEIFGPLASPDFPQGSNGEKPVTSIVDDILGGVGDGNGGPARSDNARLIDQVLGGREEGSGAPGVSTERPADRVLEGSDGSGASGFNRFDETPSMGSSSRDFGRFDNVDAGSSHAGEQPVVNPPPSNRTQWPDGVPAMAPFPAPGADAVEHRFTSRENVEGAAKHYGLPNPYHHEKSAGEIAQAIVHAAGYATAAGLNVANASLGSPVVTEFNPETGRIESNLDAQSAAESIAGAAGAKAPGIWDAVTTKGAQLQEAAGLIEGVLGSINSETPVETSGRIIKLLALGQTLDNHAASLERSIAAAQQQGRSDEAEKLQSQRDYLVKKVLPNVRSELNHEPRNVQEFIEEKMGIQPSFWRRE